MGEKPTEPDMTWLRLAPTHEAVLALAWSAGSILVDGRKLNAAHKLAARDLLRFLGSNDGGVSGRFKLSRSARAYPPVGLKKLMLYHRGCRDVTRNSRALAVKDTRP